MRVQVIVSVIGDDKAGFINQLSQQTSDIGGSWTAHKIVHLEGQLAALFKLDIDEQQLPAFKQLLSKLDGITATISELSPSTHDAMTDVNLSLECDDRKGLTADISAILSNLGILVLNFESHRYPVMGLNAGAYAAKLELKIPTSLTINTLKTQIESLGSSVRVFIADT